MKMTLFPPILPMLPLGHPPDHGLVGHPVQLELQLAARGGLPPQLLLPPLHLLPQGGALLLTPCMV